MNAKGAVFMGAKIPFDVREFELTRPASGYGQCELIASGVCGTDLHFYRGTLKTGAERIIGHEFVGRLVDCDDAEAAACGLKKGDAVIADIAVPCGKCPLCLAGDDANCANMAVTNASSVNVAPHLFGGFAEINYTPLSNLVKIPENVNPYAAAIFACPGPTVMHAISLAEKSGCSIKTTDVVVVQGLGPVGCYAVCYLKAIGVRRVIAVAGRRADERDALVRSLGADEIYYISDAGISAVTEAIRKENDSLGADVVIEASGARDAFPQGMDFLRLRGTYLVPGQYSDQGPVAISPQTITFKALHIIGSSQYSMCDVTSYLAFLSAHEDLQKRIAALGTSYPVADVNRAFADALASKNVKTVLVR